MTALPTATARARRPAGPGDGLTAELGTGLLLGTVLLAVLSGSVGLAGVGWVAGGTVAVSTAMLLDHGLRGAGARALGPANAVTYGRALLVAAVTALALSGAPRAVVVVLAAVALALDGVDGAVARRTGTTSAVGARFDMEVDAFLLLVLSGVAAGDAGPWVLGIGLMRYAFVAAGALLPWLTAPLPPRFSRKVVAAVQGVVLVTAAAGVLPAAVGTAALGAALAALCWSFGRDVAWLAVHR